MWHYPSPTTIFNSASTVLMFEDRTRHMCLFFLTAIRCEYGRALTPSNAGSDDVLLKKKRFSTDWLLVDQPLVVRQCPFKTALTASLVYVCIYFLSRTPPFPQASFLLVPDQSMVFEVFTPRIHVPISSYPWVHPNISQLVSLPVMFVWPGYRQTNTIIYSIRPSFQLGEYWTRIFDTSSPRLAQRKIKFSASRYLWKACFPQTRFSLLAGLPLSFQTNGT